MLARYMLSFDRLTVRPPVRLSHAGIVSKRQNVESQKQRWAMAQRL